MNSAWIAQNPRNPMLDLFRLFMAALVLATHFLKPFLDVTFYAFGTGGFFIAAGYFCAANPQQHYSNLGFVLTKLIRLYPAYIIAVLFYAMTKVEADAQLPLILLQHALLLLTVTSKAEAFYLNPPFWCIPVFVEFFVVFALIRNRYDPIKLFCFSLLCVVLLKLTPQGAPEWLRLHFPYYAYAFFLGGVVHKIMRLGAKWPSFLPSPRSSAMLGIGAIISLGSLFQLLGEAQLAQLPGWRFYHELCVLLYGMVLLCILHIPIPNGAWQWLMEIAKAGFSIYLFHILILHMVKPHISGVTGLCVAILGTLGLAIAVRRIVEVPTQRWGKRLMQSWKFTHKTAPT